ncbi:MAG: SDR family oxidoreductase [Gemmatimonadota bacterium]
MTTSGQNGNERLDGRVAVVTGASAGIGEASALALAEAGASVVLAARRKDRLEALAARIREAGGTALPHVADVASLDDVRSLADATLEAFGRIDILVNNAGLMPLSPMEEVRIEDWARMVDVNVKGVLHCIAALLPKMIEQGSGHVVNVGSLAGRRPFPGGTVYSATKFAVRSLSWGMHLELGAKHGIRVTDIQPGFVSTELMDTVPDPALKERWDEAWKGRRTLQPEDVARALMFAVTSPEHVSVSEVLVRPTDQAS